MSDPPRSQRIEIVAFTVDPGIYSWGQCDVRQKPQAAVEWTPLALAMGRMSTNRLIANRVQQPLQSR